MREINGNESVLPRRYTIISKLARGEYLLTSEIALIKVILIVGIGGFVLGYNVGVVSGSLDDIQSQYNLSVSMQSLFVVSMSIGTLFGSITSGILSDYIGRWKVCQLQSILFIIGSLIITLSNNISMIVIGRFINGVAAALSAVSSIPYLNEMSPVKYKGRYQGAFEINIVFGILISSLLNLLSYLCSLNWRYSYGFPAILAFIQSLLLFRIPESPSFLAQKGRFNEAKLALDVIYVDPELVDNEMVNLRLANMTKSKGRFQTFYNITRTYMICLLVAIGMVICQSISCGLLYPIFGALIFEYEGFSRHNALLNNFIINIVRFVCTILAVHRIDSLKWGRRQLLLRGVTCMIIGYLGLAIITSISSNIAINYIIILLFTIIVTIGYSISYGSVSNVIMSEIFPTIIRSRMIAIIILTYNIIQIIIIFDFIYILNTISMSSLYLILMICTIIGWIYIYLLIPETLYRDSNTILLFMTNQIYKYQQYICKCNRDPVDLNRKGSVISSHGNNIYELGLPITISNDIDSSINYEYINQLNDTSNPIYSPPIPIKSSHIDLDNAINGASIKSSRRSNDNTSNKYVNKYEKSYKSVDYYDDNNVF